MTMNALLLVTDYEPINAGADEVANDGESIK